MTQDGDKQTAIRATTQHAETFNGDWMALFDQAGIPAGDFNGRLLAWINQRLGRTYTSLPEAQQALATASGAYNWSSLGTFTVSSGPTAPVFVDPATITGIATVGQTLTATLGRITGNPAPTLTYQWKRDGGNIGSAINSTYVTQAADAGHTITVTVTGTNTAGNSSTTSAGVLVAAALSLTGSPPTTGQTGVAYSFTPTCTGGHSPYTFSLAGTLPAGLVFNTATGAITGTPTASGPFPGLTISVRDNDALTASLSAFTLTINAIPAFVGGASISGPATVGQTLTGNAGTVTGYPAPAITWQWKRDGGNIAGATGQTYQLVAADSGHSITLTATATNSAGSANSTSSGVTVAAALAISGSPGLAQVSIAYTFTPTTTGGHAAYSYTSTGALPPGLSLNPATGAISGTPSSTGTYAGIAITVTDADGLTATLSSLTITVAQVPAFTTQTVITGIDTVGQTLTATPGSTTGYPAPTVTYQWTRDASNIGGATSQTYLLQAADAGHSVACTATATNAAGSATSTASGFAIAAALAISGTPPTTGTEGVAYSFTPTASGGHTPYTFSETGALPPGLSFSTSTGAITGTCSLAGTYSGITIKVTDSDGLQATLAAFTITVASGGSTTYATLDPAQKSPSMTLSGGNLTANVASGHSGIVRSTLPATPAKVNRYEVTLQAASAPGNLEIGVYRQDGPLTDPDYCHEPDGAGYKYGGGYVLDGTWVGTSNGSFPSGSGAVVGDVVAFRFDASNNQMYYAINNGAWVASGYPAGLPPSPPPIYAALNGGNFTAKLNFGASAPAFKALDPGEVWWGQGAPALSAPVFVSGAVIHGVLTVGQTLTCDPGQVTGNPTPTLAYQWKKDGANIAGATASTYVPVTGDGTHTITVTVTATNSQGSANSTSSGVLIAAAVTITGTPPTTGTVGTAITTFTPTAAGGHTPYGFALTGSALPPGLAFSASTGAVSGTPTTTGTYGGIVIQVTDADGLSAALAAFTMVISAVTVTMDPANKSPAFALSGGNLVATTGGTNGIGRSTVPAATGKLNRFEVTIGSSLASNATTIGVYGSDGPLTNGDWINEPTPGGYKYGCGVVQPDGYFAGTVNGTIPGFATANVGDVVAIRYDEATRMLTYAVNGGAWQDSGWACGTDPAITQFYAAASGTNFTLTFNFGASPPAFIPLGTGEVWWGGGSGGGGGGGGTSIPMVQPAVSWTGSTLAPSTPPAGFDDSAYVRPTDGTGAKAILLPWCLSNRRITSASHPERIIGVHAFAFGGLSKVEAWVEGTVVQLPYVVNNRATLLGTSDPEDGYFFELDWANCVGRAAKGTVQVWFLATPANASVKKRAIGPFTFYPRAAGPDATFPEADQVFTVGTGGTYATLGAALDAAADAVNLGRRGRGGDGDDDEDDGDDGEGRGGGHGHPRTGAPECPLIKIVSNGKYNWGTNPSTKLAGPQASIIGCAPGVTASINFDRSGQGDIDANYDPNPYAGWHTRAQLVPFELRGPNLTIDFDVWVGWQLWQNKPITFNACEITSTMNGVFNIAFNKSTQFFDMWQASGGDGLRQYQDCRVDNLDGHLQPSLSGYPVVKNCIGYFWGMGRLFNPHNAMFAHNKLIRADSRYYRTNRRPFSISYTGAGTAQLAFSVADWSIRATVNGVQQGSVLYAVATPDAADATHVYSVAQLAAKINALSGFSMTALDDRLHMRGCFGPGGQTVALSSTAVTPWAMYDIHSEWYQALGSGYAYWDQNNLLYGNLNFDAFYASMPLNAGQYMLDTALIGNVILTRPSHKGGGLNSASGWSGEHTLAISNIDDGAQSLVAGLSPAPNFASTWQFNYWPYVIYSLASWPTTIGGVKNNLAQTSAPAFTADGVNTGNVVVNSDNNQANAASRYYASFTDIENFDLRPKAGTAWPTNLFTGAQRNAYDIQGFTYAASDIAGPFAAGHPSITHPAAIHGSNAHFEGYHWPNTKYSNYGKTATFTGTGPVSYSVCSSFIFHNNLAPIWSTATSQTFWYFWGMKVHFGLGAGRTNGQAIGVCNTKFGTSYAPGATGSESAAVFPSGAAKDRGTSSTQGAGYSSDVWVMCCWRSDIQRFYYCPAGGSWNGDPVAGTGGLSTPSPVINQGTGDNYPMTVFATMADQNDSVTLDGWASDASLASLRSALVAAGYIQLEDAYA